MVPGISERVWKILACPHCGGSLCERGGAAACDRCALRYPRAASGALDLRLQRPKTVRSAVTLGTPPLPPPGWAARPLPSTPTPEVDFTGCGVPRHLSRAILDHFPKATTSSSLMLDLGCGDSLHREVCERAGFEYLGLDQSAAAAAILGDAHALPFADASFEFLLSLAVLEHIRFPFVMMREAHRVLGPDGLFIGTVAFLEPFHDDSYYHHSHLGTYNSLREGGFSVEHISPEVEWPVLVAQAAMGLFPGMPRSLSRCLVLPLQLLHRAWWKARGLARGTSLDAMRINNTSGAFIFIARRRALAAGRGPETPPGS